MVLGSFASGGLLTSYGWDAVCWVALPPLAVTILVLLATGSLRRVVPVAGS
jgi:hypothetical protein